MSWFSWDKRVRRAERLAAEYPSSAEILRFYGQIARFQEKVYERLQREAPNRPPQCLEADLPQLLHLLERIGRPGLAEKARGHTFSQISAADAPAEFQFLARVLLQPYMECLVGRNGVAAADCPPECPACGDRPQAAVLRGEGEGGKRWLLCALCSSEWEFRRLLCPNCGEEDKDRLPVYTTEAFPHVRVEACDGCHTYIKAIDLTKNGLAIPCVDELASIPLNLWAEEAGYVKLQRNILLL